MTDQDDKLTQRRREILRSVRRFPTLQKRLRLTMNDPCELARVAPEPYSTERRLDSESLTEDGYERISARISLFLEDVEHNCAFARSRSADVILTEALAAFASEQTELRHCGWLLEPLPPELRAAARADLSKMVAQLHAACLPRRMQLAAAAAKDGKHNPRLREALEALVVERCVAAHAGDNSAARLEALDRLIRDDFPELAASYPLHERGLEDLVGNVGRAKPNLRAALRHAGARVIVPTHLKLLHNPSKHSTLYMAGAMLDAFAALDEVRSDVDVLFLICEDIIVSESKRAVRRGWPKDDCLAVAGECLCKVQAHANDMHLDSFRAYFRSSLQNAFSGSPPKPGGEGHHEIDENGIAAEPMPEQWEKAERLAFADVLDLCLCEFWPAPGRAAARRKYAGVIVRALRGWIEQGDCKLSFREHCSEQLARELPDTSSKSLDKVRERVRKDVTNKVAEVCKRASCEGVASQLTAILIHHLDPVFVPDAPGSSPHVLRDLQHAKQKLENAKHRPEWLFRLVEWLINFLEGRP